jgi:hypothetical protein
VYNTKIFKLRGPPKTGLSFWVSYTSYELEEGGVYMILQFVIVYSAAILDLVDGAFAIIERDKE